MAQDPSPQPSQQQPYPGWESEMEPEPRDEMRDYVGRELLAGKRALITGGDSGIGRAVAVAFAKEGADVAIAYLAEDSDAEHTAKVVRAAGRGCHLLRADLAQEEECLRTARAAVEALGGVDILVNHVGYQHPVSEFSEITTEQWDTTFKVNIYSFFWMAKACLPHMPQGSTVINTGSVNGLRGNKSLIDYAATKGAVQSLTYSMGQSLISHGIRVNCVAPGPVWTPLIPSTFGEEKVASFGRQVPMQRWAHPDEIAPSYVFFAANRLSSYYTGEVLAPIGGETLPG